MARITFVGHATVLIEIGGVRVLTDPLLRTRLGHLRRHGAAPDRAVTERLDAVLISHMHLDHLDMKSLRMLDPGVRFVVPSRAGGFMRRMGFPNVVELTPGESFELTPNRSTEPPPGSSSKPGASTAQPGVEVVATTAVHDGRRRPLGGHEADAIGFVLKGERSVYFAGDTDLFPEMADAPHSGLDLALLPVWGWGPTLGAGHLDPGAAAEAAALLRPRVAVPIHWGTFYPAGFARARPRPLRDPPHAFAAQVAEVAPSVEVSVLEPGESLEIAPEAEAAPVSPDAPAPESDASER